jgi:peptide/nickel transport system permease protein
LFNFNNETIVTLKILVKNKLSFIGLIITSSFILLSLIITIFGYSILPYNPIESNLSEALLPPSWNHPFGTDDLGRDVLSRIIAAAPLDLQIALIVVIPSTVIGTILGALSGYFGGKLDEFVMRITDIFLAFPGLILALAVAATLGPSITNTMIALMIVWWPYYTRLARGEALSIKENQYIEASRAAGLKEISIITRHVLPNLIVPIVVYATFDLGRIILAATVLSYIGLGAQPPTPEWGRMVSETQGHLFNRWWLPLAPAATILLVVLGFNLLGDGLRDAYDPKLRQIYLAKKEVEEGIQKIPMKEIKGEVLTISGLQLIFKTPGGIIKALDGVNLWLNRNEVLGIVGESGAGKSVLGLSVLGLVPRPPGKYLGGSIKFQDKEILSLSEKELTNIRGTKVSIIFQDPSTALNPVLTVGDQVAEAVKVRLKREGLKRPSKDIVKKEVIKILNEVKLPTPEMIMKMYPHELSGGMKQRIMLSIALATKPVLLIADEPTTALDVTTQAQILQLIIDMMRERGMSILYITHDFSIIAEIADRVVVMYAGQVVESGPVRSIFKKPLHPYTQGLLNSIPSLSKIKKEITPLIGFPPSPINPPSGCRFHPRCPYAMTKCSKIIPELHEIEKEHWVACHLYSKEGGFIE